MRARPRSTAAKFRSSGIGLRLSLFVLLHASSATRPLAASAWLVTPPATTTTAPTTTTSATPRTRRAPFCNSPTIGRITDRQIQRRWRRHGILLPALSASSSAPRDGQVGSGPNWIERSFPVDTTEAAKVDPKAVIDYDLGISGASLQVGPLSGRMYEAIVSKSKLFLTASNEVKRAYRLYAMDFTAKEAVRAALKQNGLELVLQEDEQDEGLWADVDSIELLDEAGTAPVSQLFDSWDDAVDHWTPGQGFNFVARQVPAKMRELTLEELMQALDPDGALREQAKSTGMRLPDDEVATLRDLADENVRRVEAAPREAVDARNAFAGSVDSRGYQPIRASDLLVESTNRDGTESDRTTMHVMDALVSHGALLVDLSDGGTTFSKPGVMGRLWKATEAFFERAAAEGNKLPTMTTALETGSHHAKVGFAAYDNGNLQFLETRLTREGELLPSPADLRLSEDDAQALKDSFAVVAQIGQDVVRIATAASSVEAGALEGAAASDSALLLATELVDDGKALNSETLAPMEGSVSMSPHRLCRYANEPKAAIRNATASSTREVFGAHTDSTFITAVPVAAVAGLEVYDEATSRWYRPELAARQHWQLEQARRSNDPDAVVDTLEDGSVLPWHARYVVLMPGEMLQLVTRSEVLAAVHRVVATEDERARLSAPILLRGRPGTVLNVDRYLGGVQPSGDSILSECDGMTIEQIHDSMQPSSFQ